MCDMALLRGDMRRLADRVEQRRGELGLTQRDVQAVGGPSPATMSLIEGAQRESIQVGVAGKLERALQWAAGSVRAILAGGEPTPLEGAAAREPATLGGLTAATGSVLPLAAKLIEGAREKAGLSVEEAAKLADLSPDDWRHLLAAGGTGEDELSAAFARMARVVGVESFQLRNAGRADAAHQFQLMVARERYGHLSTEQLRLRAAQYDAAVRRALIEEGMDAGSRQLKEIDRYVQGASEVMAKAEDRARKRDTAQ